MTVRYKSHISIQSLTLLTLVVAPIPQWDEIRCNNTRYGQEASSTELSQSESAQVTYESILKPVTHPCEGSCRYQNVNVRTEGAKHRSEAEEQAAGVHRERPPQSIHKDSIDGYYYDNISIPVPSTSLHDSGAKEGTRTTLTGCAGQGEDTAQIARQLGMVESTTDTRR